MINLVWSALLALLLLSGCGWNGTPSRSNDFVPLTSIEISADYSSIAVGTSTRLTVKGNYSGLFTKDISSQAEWLLNSFDTLDVADTGDLNQFRVKGVAAGSDTVTATVNGLTATHTIKVTSAAVTSMAVTPSAPSVPQGLTTQFTVIGTFSDLTTQDLTFDATWGSSDAAIATVSDDVASKGLATAVAATGTATITATFDTASGTAQLTATEPVPQSITVTPANPSLLSLSTGSFQATGHYSDTSTRDITAQVTWTSSNTAIAAIAAGGAATALSQGNATITASMPGVSGTTNLKVTGGALTGFTISPPTVSLVTGTVTRMIATGTFSNGAKRDISGVVAWSPANTSLATVTKAGGNLIWLNALAVTPLTTVTASYGTTLTATTNLTVTAPTPQSLVINPPSSFVDLTAGTSAHFTATATFNDGSIQDVTTSSTWTSLDTSRATVGDSGIDKGRVTGKASASGAVTIRAVYGGKTYDYPMTVTLRTINSLSISPTAANVAAGNQVPFAATASYIGGTSKDVTEDATWAIDSSSVAIPADSTNQPGQVVGFDSGSTTLRAAFGGNSATATITVP